ncbi:hypothetical protein NNJEOMEG_01543 [Fundidesulfovibrio magnetotacticus]|uniref:Lipoprotein n=1 Tax=Fundidesulfovibrio magnetotacticus TaxID=2730080 RepID=A0A6V8LUC2_9BACT|nr:hypothetical protein [Fundidesulfovibrio magnetotacticus]GFK93709.1 hypothetical protein NNJEOMEG_01543 [Fundidesulfovibrio magnetotacticus]
MRRTALFVLVALLGACSGPPRIVNPNKSAAEARGDYDECRARSAVSTALAPAKEAEALAQKILDGCMRAKGYTVEGP